MSIYLAETVRLTIQKYRLIPPDSRVVVGVSGGADSLALLHILHGLSTSLNIQLHAATFDHQLRGKDSEADAAFVRQTCEAWGIPVTVGSTDVKALAQEAHIGVETAARNARYVFLASVAQQCVTKYIVVAHHADDQAETLLLHLMRGAGMRGLIGMSWQAPVPGFPDLILIRPLLSVTRTDIETYCREQNLAPREDHSNEDTRILRNYLRHETLPHLVGLNPQIQRTLGRLAETMSVENDFLTIQLNTAIQQITEVSTLRVRLQREGFRTLHTALQRRLLIWAAEQVGAADDVDYEHIVDAVEIGLSGGQGAIAQLKHGLQLRVDYEWLVVVKASTPAELIDVPRIETDVEIAVEVPSTIELAGWALRTSVEGLSETTQICSLVVPEGSRIWLRSRRGGDRITPLGMGGHTQKVSHWMINHRVPHMVRNYLPLLIIENEVAAIWFEGKWAISERFKLPNAGRVVHFELRQHS